MSTVVLNIHRRAIDNKRFPKQLLWVSWLQGRCHYQILTGIRTWISNYSHGFRWSGWAREHIGIRYQWWHRHCHTITWHIIGSSISKWRWERGCISTLQWVHLFCSVCACRLNKMEPNPTMQLTLWFYPPDDAAKRMSTKSKTLDKMGRIIMLRVMSRMSNCAQPIAKMSIKIQDCTVDVGLVLQKPWIAPFSVFILCLWYSPLWYFFPGINFDCNKEITYINKGSVIPKALLWSLRWEYYHFVSSNFEINYLYVHMKA